MIENRFANLAFIIIGAALQSVAAFEIDAVKPYSAGVLMFAGVLMTLGRWDKIKGSK